MFVEVSKSIIFLLKSFLGKFYRHLAIFFWSHCWVAAVLESFTIIISKKRETWPEILWYLTKWDSKICFTYPEVCTIFFQLASSSDSGEACNAGNWVQYFWSPTMMTTRGSSFASTSNPCRRRKKIRKFFAQYFGRILRPGRWWSWCRRPCRCRCEGSACLGPCLATGRFVQILKTLDF